jgi:RNA polymerase sigma-70 factor (ECF subfamily)
MLAIACFSRYDRRLVPTTEGPVWQGSLDVSRDQRNSGSAADVSDFVDAIRSHDRDLRCLCYHLLGGAGEVDDVMQDTYLKAFVSLSRFRRKASFATWLYRIAYRTCVDRQRNSQRSSALNERLSLVAPVVADETELWAKSDGPLRAALMGLGIEQRAAVFLVDVVGFTYAEAADALHLPVGTVASRVARARAVLREALTQSASEEMS